MPLRQPQNNGRPHTAPPEMGPPDIYSPEMQQAIMPDFAACRRTLYRLDMFFVLINAPLEFLYYLLLISQNRIHFPETSYLLWHMVLPTLLNALILTGILLFRKRVPEKIVPIQNALPVFAMEMMCWVVCLTHCVRPITLATFLIPICMTTLFADKQGCTVMTRFSAAGIVVSSLRRAWVAGEAASYSEIALEALTALIALFVLSTSAMAVLRMTVGQRDKLVAFFRDTKTAQARAEEAQAKAEAASKAKSDFLANMSHEIRTPINAILGMNEMVLRESRDPQIIEYAQSIHSASASLLSLVNDVLDFSKIESGKLEIVEMPYDTASFFHDCYNMVTDRAAKKGLEFKVDISPELPVSMKGDEVRLRQIATNLLSNAVKYTEKGSVSLAASCTREGDRLLLTMTVKDTGIGIKPEDQEALFAQFSRLDLERNRTVEGTGLGLAITKQLVGLMHGELRLQSTYGEGSSFSVTIPQVVVNDTPIGDFHKRYQDISRRNAEHHQSFTAPDARLLVVDDVEINLKVMVNLLKETRVHVDTAISGFQCLEMAAQQHYDLIFLDHMMPEMNGIETYKRLKQLPACPNHETPVIMLTANAITGVKEQYLQEGFSDYLSKPVSGDKLESTLLKFLPPEMIGKAEPAADAPEPLITPEAVDRLTRLQALYQAYPGVDLMQGISRCQNSAEGCLNALRAFGQNDRLAQIENSYANHDAAACRQLLQEAAGAAENTGFTALAGQASALESALGAEDPAQAEALYPAFCQEYRAVQRAIAAFIL